MQRYFLSNWLYFVRLCLHFAKPKTQPQHQFAHWTQLRLTCIQSCDFFHIVLRNGLLILIFISLNEDWNRSEIHGKSTTLKDTSTGENRTNGNIFRVTGHLCGEFTGHRWIPHTKASDAELWCFLWSAPWIYGWVNNREAGDFRRHRAHYDTIVLISRRWNDQRRGPVYHTLWIPCTVTRPL